MASGLTIDDRAFMSAFAAMTARDRKNSREGMKRYGAAATAAMRRHIHSDSGDLAASVGIEDHTGDDPPWVEIGAFETAPDPHGLFDEFGTIHMAPRAFARPGLLEAEHEFVVDP